MRIITGKDHVRRKQYFLCAFATVIQFIFATSTLVLADSGSPEKIPPLTKEQLTQKEQWLAKYRKAKPAERDEMESSVEKQIASFCKKARGGAGQALAVQHIRDLPAVKEVKRIGEPYLYRVTFMNGLKATYPCHPSELKNAL